MITETSSAELETGEEAAENKTVEEPKTNQMGKRVDSLSTSSEVHLL